MSNLDRYNPALKHWNKSFGPKPTDAAFAVAHAFVRPGKHALALAMYMRPEGATDAEIRGAAGKLNATGKPQGSLHNYRRMLIEAGDLKRDADYPKRDGDVVYRCELTAKGQKVVDRTIKALEAKAAAEAAKATPKAPKAPRVRKAPTPAPAPETAPVATSEATSGTSVAVVDQQASA